AIDAPGAEVPIRTQGHISRHANFGGAPLVVSLGCEKMQPARLFPGEELRSLPVLDGGLYVLRLQDHRGFAETIAAIMRFAEERLDELNRRRRRPLPAPSLVVGLQCGGSDAFS